MPTRLQPANVATPDEAVAVRPPVLVHDSVPPEGARVTEADDEVTVFPPASWTMTTGWEPKAAALVAVVEGWVVKTTLVAVPKAARVKALEVALREPDVAFSVNEPAVPDRVQEVKEATPEENDAVQLVSVPPVPELMAIVMAVEYDVTTLPDESSTFTTGVVDMTVALMAPDGWVVKTNCDAAPGVNVTALVVSDVKDPSVAVRVKLDARPVTLHPAKMATPEDTLSGLVVQARVPADEASVTLVVESEVTTFPPESSTLTKGWVVHAAPFVQPEGSVVKATWEAVPAVMVALAATEFVSPEVYTENRFVYGPAAEGFVIPDMVRVPWVPPPRLQL